MIFIYKRPELRGIADLEAFYKKQTHLVPARQYYNPKFRTEN
jgi:hypothetical protein